MSLTSFTIFPRLPLELRLKIWGHVANSQPRTLDIWTDFKRCEVENTTFYTQAYQCELSNITPPPIFRVNHEARTEALKHYSLEFATGMTLPCGISVNISPRMYVNYSTDTLIPRGYWNIVSFADFAKRAAGRLKTLAVDVNGVFWKENLRDYCKKQCWVFSELDELILYDTSNDDMFKGSDFLEKFRKKHKDGPRDLSFHDWTGEVSQSMSEVKEFLEEMFDRIEGKVEDVVPEVGEDGEPVEVKEVTHPSYLDGFESTEAEDLQRPHLRLCDMLATKPVAPVVSVA
ncbi:uncharacterized protein PAC_13501 [Phialocephala subalpina]|uniref:2EXR domain-containing protein n=1 Tax=Phialocephala subalpina TaxID=576137 RepID=A0A1L7XF04_9HELO|nr:uncharacterized protein PAC_13501 [Phialocephala subalpina]